MFQLTSQDAMRCGARLVDGQRQASIAAHWAKKVFLACLVQWLEHSTISSISHEVLSKCSHGSTIIPCIRSNGESKLSGISENGNRYVLA